jgi:predicted DNA-binding protein
MKTRRSNILTKMVSFTIKHETIQRLDEFSKKKSINKSGFVDRLINEEIDREENGKRK